MMMDGDLYTQRAAFIHRQANERVCCCSCCACKKRVISSSRHHNDKQLPTGQTRLGARGIYHNISDTSTTTTTGIYLAQLVT